MRRVISNKHHCGFMFACVLICVCACVPSSRREDDAREPGSVLLRLKEDSESDGLDD